MNETEVALAVVFGIIFFLILILLFSIVLHTANFTAVDSDGDHDF